MWSDWSLDFGQHLAECHEIHPLMSVNVLWESQQWFSGSGIFFYLFFYTMDCISVTKWLDLWHHPLCRFGAFYPLLFNRKGPFTNQRASCMNRIYHFAAIAQAQQTAMKLHWCNFAGWIFGLYIYIFFFRIWMKTSDKMTIAFANKCSVAQNALRY